MTSKNITVSLPQGFSQQHAAKMVSALHPLDCKVYLQRGSKRIDAKSILGVISLALRSGDVVSVIGDGADEESALEAVESCLVG